MGYQQALAELQLRPTVEPGSPEEQAAIGRFVDFVSVLTAETVRAKAGQVYAEDAYFNDTLKELRGAAAIEAYMVESMGATEQTTVEVTEVAQANGNYYFRWVMEIRFKKLNQGQPTWSIGMSHVRFDAQGKVALHQDYWDSTSGLFEHIPVLGWLIGIVKGRI